MQPHAVPQNITGFEFRLIGNLTLRQFGYLGVAAVFDFILYSAKVPFFFILLIGGPVSLLALALAFLPVNNQPFERWLVSLLRTIYSPSLRVWRREPKEIGFLAPQFSIYLHRQEGFQAPKVVSDRSKLNQYLKEHAPKRKRLTADINEETRLAQLNLNNATSEKETFVPEQIAGATQPEAKSRGLLTPLGEVNSLLSSKLAGKTGEGK